MDKSAIDTPSREIDLRNIPVHLRTALRRALEFEARAPAPRSAEEAEQCEEQLRAIADEFFGALLTPVLQRAVRSAAVGDAASALVRHLPRRMRSDGLETVNVRTSRGTTVPVTTPYYREKHARRAKRRPGLYPALVVLGIYDRCTPKLASDASRAVAMLSSLAEAQAQLRSDGIVLDIKTLRSTAYRYAARARAVQQSAACGLLDRVTGKRVVVSLDGGRVRVRRKKRGPKTKKGRNRFHTDWKEPKLLILYVVGDDGRPSQTWAPIIDGTLRGPEAVFALLLSYARQIGLNAADKVLFIADGAPWIWQRIQRLIAALGLSPTQVLGLIDFYHAAKQLSDAVKLRRWSATQRTRWINRTRGLLKRARVDEVITALRELCRGRTAGKIRTHLNYFLKNRHRFAYTTMVGLHTVPQSADEYGSDTWLDESWRYSGNTNIWSMMSGDEELGWVFLPIGTPTSDYYGGHRLGDNLFAESLVAVDVETGQRQWHFQMIHHGLWDWDLPAAPNLLDITVDGRPIKAVAQVSKQGFVYVFDRVTGEPVWPIEELPVATDTDLEGEILSPTQPFPTRPAPFEYQGASIDDLVDFTPEIRQMAVDAVEGFRLGPLYTPQTLRGTIMRPPVGGGASWSGAAVDPETGYLYVPSFNGHSTIQLTEPEPNEPSTLRYIRRSVSAGPVMPRGLPLWKPPYTRMTAIDMNTGEHAWMIPTGNGDRIRNHPMLRDLDLPPLGGDAGRSGPLLTKTVLIHALTAGGSDGGPRLVAYDKASGAEIASLDLPGGALGAPMTYLLDGVQHIALTVGGEVPGLIAFRLPE